MLAAEFVVNWSFRNVFIADWQTNPAQVWQHDVVYNVLIKLAFVALFFARGQRANIAALLALNAIFVVLYWVQ